MVCREASLHAVGDEIEYDNDGVLRTVTEVDTCTNTVTFDHVLGGPSAAGKAIKNYGWGDMGGQDRVMCGRVDMGSDEFVAGDLDFDSDVDGIDFLTFSNCFNWSARPALEGCENPGADLDGDGDVDGFDFITFSLCFNGSGSVPGCE